MKQASGWLLFIAVILLAYGSKDAERSGKPLEIEWMELEEAQEAAKSNGGKVLIYAWAEWCVYCKRMDEEVYSRDEISDLVQEHFYPVKLDIESDEVVTYNGDRMTESELAGELQVQATPSFYFLSSQGEIIGMQPGFIPSDVFSTLLTYIGTEAYENMKFREFMRKKEDSDS